MDKKYQVFVSSTYIDLIEERNQASRAILDTGCIPAGMEQFPAFDEEQFNYIKRIIDQKVSTERMCKMWQNVSELHGQIGISLMKTIQERPAVGWVRANNVASTEILSELNEQRKLNEQLREENNILQQYKEYITATETNSLAGLDDEITIHGTYSRSDPYSKRWVTENWQTTISWGELFALIAPHVFDKPRDDYAKTTIEGVLKEHTKFSRIITLKDYDFQTIKVHLEALGLISVARGKMANGGSATFWGLTHIAAIA